MLNIEDFDSDGRLRFSSAPWANIIRNKEVLIAGCGGIGSWISLLVSRIGPSRIILVDMDDIERVNLGGQLFRCDQLGQSKVNACVNNMSQYSNYYSYRALNSRIQDVLPNFAAVTFPHIFICGFDNMEARQYCFNSWKQKVLSMEEDVRDRYLFIDARLAAEYLQVFAIVGNDSYNINNYAANHLFTDAEADETVCSYKQTSHIAAMIAAIVVNVITNYLTNENYEEYYRDVPFFTEYNAEMLMLKTSNQ